MNIFGFILKRDEEEVAQTKSNAVGSYRLSIYPVGGTYSLSAISDKRGALKSGIQLSEGERRTLNLVLKEAVSIEGRLVMLDDTTPHVSVWVQALRNRKVIATGLSDERGRYRFINLKPGRYKLRCQVLNGYVYYNTEEEVLGVTSYDSRADENAGDSLSVERGKKLQNIDFRFAPFKKGTWKNYTTLDGLASNVIEGIYRHPNGTMLFETDGGVSQYDGNQFINFTTEDRLVHNNIWNICFTPDGVMWFSTPNGVSRYNGKQVRSFTSKDGLAYNFVRDIYCDPEGVLWFATWGGGVSRYDGKTFQNFLSGNSVVAIHHDLDGAMWFGTWGGGVSQYKGNQFRNFTTADGLANNVVLAIHCDPDGVMWFGTREGLSQYDGKQFVNFTTEDGLAHNQINRAIYRDPDGVLWVGTDGSGVALYDGTVWSSLDTRDGLAGNTVASIHRDSEGYLWYGLPRRSRIVRPSG